MYIFIFKIVEVPVAQRYYNFARFPAETILHLCFRVKHFGLSNTFFFVELHSKLYRIFNICLYLTLSKFVLVIFKLGAIAW